MRERRRFQVGDRVRILRAFLDEDRRGTWQVKTDEFK